MVGMMDCAALQGFNATLVKVEVDISRGLPSFQLVGLAENSVKEARIRVQSAISNAGFDFPKAKICVNLAPADVQKTGTAFDLPIALGILQASGIVSSAKLKDISAIGELSLTGAIKPVRGMLALAEAMKLQGSKTLIVAKDNAPEASLIKGIDIKVADTLGEMVRAINAEKVASLENAGSFRCINDLEFSLDMKDVVGQTDARRALLIAASGNHNLIFIGGPGSGKSMMAHRLPSILPSLSYEESLTLTKIYSLAGHTIFGKLIEKRPFRSPHHSTTRAGLIGGGSKNIRPGEVSLACFGVLFLDELLEFPRNVLEVLREPLEDGKISLSRAQSSVTFPAQFSLVAALNPCPCGHFGQGGQPCICSPLQVERYQSKLSGPLLDRIDLQVNVPPVNLNLMRINDEGESSQSMRVQVEKARVLQRSRFKSHLTNGRMNRAEIKNLALVTDKAYQFLLFSSGKLKMSARGFDRIIRVARTIADLEMSPLVHEHHVGEALHYRPVKATFLS